MLSFFNLSYGMMSSKACIDPVPLNNLKYKARLQEITFIWNKGGSGSGPLKSHRKFLKSAGVACLLLIMISTSVACYSNLSPVEFEKGPGRLFLSFLCRLYDLIKELPGGV